MNPLNKIRCYRPLPMLSLLALHVVTPGHLGAGTLPSAPPWWPDSTYVKNGCYVSAFVYMARLWENYPDVAAQPVTVHLSDGSSHTIVTVKWGHRLYLRDPFVGVAPVDGTPQRSFDRALAMWRKTAGRHTYDERSIATREGRHREINLAAELLAFARPEIVLTEYRGEVVTVLSWKTPTGQIALYEPTFGTAVGASQRPPAQIARDLLVTFNEGRPKKAEVELVCGNPARTDQKESTLLPSTRVGRPPT